MADEVLESCLQNFRDYNMKSYLLMRSKLLSTSSELCVEDPTWTMENIGKALWTFAVLSVNDRSSAESNDTESASKVSKKRSRVENSRETQTEDIGRKNDEPPASKAKVQSRTLSGRVRKEVDRFVPPK